LENLENIYCTSGWPPAWGQPWPPAQLTKRPPRKYIFQRAVGLFKHMINLSKMLFLVRQAEKSHKLREATPEIAQVERTRAGPSRFVVPGLSGSACQGHASVQSSEGFCPQSLGSALGLLFLFKGTMFKFNVVISRKDVPWARSPCGAAVREARSSADGECYGRAAEHL